MAGVRWIIWDGDDIVLIDLLKAYAEYLPSYVQIKIPVGISLFYEGRELMTKADEYLNKDDIL